MTFHIDNLKDKTKKEILEVWDIAQEHMSKQDEKIKALESEMMSQTEVDVYTLKQQIKGITDAINWLEYTHPFESSKCAKSLNHFNDGLKKQLKSLKGGE